MLQCFNATMLQCYNATMLQCYNATMYIWSRCLALHFFYLLIKKIKDITISGMENETAHLWIPEFTHCSIVALKH